MPIGGRMYFFRAFVVSLIVLFSCQRVTKKESETNVHLPTSAASSNSTSIVTSTTPNPVNNSTPLSVDTHRNVRLYAIVNFQKLRHLHLLKSNAEQIRSAFARQGILGKLIFCGADPFSNLERVQAILPSDFRRNLQGSITVEGTFDTTRVRSCLASEFQKENYKHEPRNDVDVFIHPRLTFELSSPKSGLLRATSQQWKDVEISTDMLKLFTKVGPDHALYVGIQGHVMPQYPQLTAFAMAFLPTVNALSAQGRLQFKREEAAAVVHTVLLAKIKKRSQQTTADSEMQMAARVFDKVLITRDNNDIVISATIPYTEVVPLLRLFQFKIKKTF